MISTKVLLPLAGVVSAGLVVWNTYTTLIQRPPVPPADARASMRAKANLKDPHVAEPYQDEIDVEDAELPDTLPYIPGSLSEALMEKPDGDDQKPWLDAVGFLRTAAANGDKSFIDEISKLPSECPSCKRFFAQTRNLFNSSELSYDEKAYIARALAASGKAENQSFLIQEMNKAANPESSAAATTQDGSSTASGTEGAVNSLPEDTSLPPATIGNELEKQKLAPEAIKELEPSLDSPNKYLREAAISILTRQNSLEAVQELYEFTASQSDPRGYYNKGMGLGHLTPSEAAFPYLESLVQRHDAYSHLAFKALLNAGEPGRARAFAMLESMGGAEVDRSIIVNAVDHIPLKGPALQEMKGLLSSPNPTIRELASQAVAERQSQIDEQNKVIELNQYSDLGLVPQ